MVPSFFVLVMTSPKHLGTKWGMENVLSVSHSKMANPNGRIRSTGCFGKFYIFLAYKSELWKWDGVSRYLFVLIKCVMKHTYSVGERQQAVWKTVHIICGSICRFTLHVNTLLLLYTLWSTWSNYQSINGKIFWKNWWHFFLIPQFYIDNCSIVKTRSHTSPRKIWLLWLTTAGLKAKEWTCQSLWLGYGHYS